MYLLDLQKVGIDVKIISGVGTIAELDRIPASHKDEILQKFVRMNNLKFRAALFFFIFNFILIVSYAFYSQEIMIICR